MLLTKKKLYKIRKSKIQSRKRYKKKKGGRRNRRKNKSFRKRRKALNLRKRTLKYKKRGGARNELFVILPKEKTGNLVRSFVLARITKPANLSSAEFIAVLSGAPQTSPAANAFMYSMKHMTDLFGGDGGGGGTDTEHFHGIQLYTRDLTFAEFCNLRNQLLRAQIPGNLTQQQATEIIQPSQGPRTSTDQPRELKEADSEETIEDVPRPRPVLPTPIENYADVPIPGGPVSQDGTTACGDCDALNEEQCKKCVSNGCAFRTDRQATMEEMRLGIHVKPGCHNVDESDRKAQRAMAAATAAGRMRRRQKERQKLHSQQLPGIGEINEDSERARDILGLNEPEDPNSIFSDNRPTITQQRERERIAAEKIQKFKRNKMGCKTNQECLPEGLCLKPAGSENDPNARGKCRPKEYARQILRNRKQTPEDNEPAEEISSLFGE